jgi:Ankyrin repeats (3 copies)/SAM domain (Sterile alpha motif)
MSMLKRSSSLRGNREKRWSIKGARICCWTSPPALVSDPSWPTRPFLGVFFSEPFRFIYSWIEVLEAQVEAKYGSEEDRFFFDVSTDDGVKVEGEREKNRTKAHSGLTPSFNETFMMFVSPFPNEFSAVCTISLTSDVHSTRTNDDFDDVLVHLSLSVKLKLAEKSRRRSVVGRCVVNASELMMTRTVADLWCEVLDPSAGKSGKSAKSVGRVHVAIRRKQNASLRSAMRRLATTSDLTDVSSSAEAVPLDALKADGPFLRGVALQYREKVQDFFICSLRNVTKSGCLVILETKLLFFGSAIPEPAMLQHCHMDVALTDVIRCTRNHAPFAVKGLIDLQIPTGKFSFGGFSNRDKAFAALRSVLPSKAASTPVVPKLRSMPSMNSDGLMVAERPESELFEVVNAEDADRVHQLFCGNHPPHEPTDTIVPDPQVTAADVNQQDQFGFSILHVVFQSGDTPFSMLRDILTFRGTVVDLPTHVDHTMPLHYLCQKFSRPEHIEQVFGWFLKKGANVNAETAHGETPLHKAIMNNAIRVLLVDLLLQNGANPNIVNKNGEAPLHYAVRLGRKDVVWPLLLARADMNIKGNVELKSAVEHKTPVEIAKDEGFTDISEMLDNAWKLQCWMKENGVDEYYPTFLEEEMFMEEMIYLDDALIERMGVKTVGHRLKLKRAVTKLRGTAAKPGTPQIPLLALVEPEKEDSMGLDDFDKMLDALGKDEDEAVGDAEGADELRQEIGDDANWIDESELEFTKNLVSAGPESCTSVGMTARKLPSRCSRTKTRLPLMSSRRNLWLCRQFTVRSRSSSTVHVWNRDERW